MDRQDLMNALRLVGDYCSSVQQHDEYIHICNGCLIYDECDKNFKITPEDWDLDDDK